MPLDPEAFDVEGTFEVSDYHYFYDPLLTEERSEQEATLIWQLLGLQPGLPVLDLACGYGRIANRLAARGCLLSGVDQSAAFLAQARAEAERWGLAVDYRQGDMRSLPAEWTGRFAAVLSWFTSFGYFSDEGNRQVLAEIARVLQPGGRLLLDLQNRERLLRESQQTRVLERDGAWQIDQLRYDVLSGRLQTRRVILRDGRQRETHFFVRLFTLPELADWLRQAGFSRVEAYNEQGAPFSLESRRLLTVATR
ncbi:class I SAM-dependent methyltransferase [Thermogemmatispora carboxidivorans]|uniref:class I SAM-dependent methyltransferase n=1 Tax=Thermogemmatispora carboxidivorans TaxID=1382306 RepID=UPI00069A9AEA|nr:class I SAM-dependent methyltransferase [Thermogemmatispora carboxidivorans]